MLVGPPLRRALARAKSSRFWTMRRVRSDSWTRRPASCRMSSGSRSSPRSSWLKAMIAASGLFSSWATPDTSCADGLHLLGLQQLAGETLLIREVAHQMQEAALAAELDDPDLDLDRELGAVRPAPPVLERAAALGPDELPAAGHLALVGGDELAEVAAQHLATVDAIHADGRLVGVEDGPVQGGHEQGVGRFLEEGAIPLLRRDQALAKAVVGEGDARDPGHRVEGGLVERQRGGRRCSKKHSRAPASSSPVRIGIAPNERKPVARASGRTRSLTCPAAKSPRTLPPPDRSRLPPGASFAGTPLSQSRKAPVSPATACVSK